MCCGPYSNTHIYTPTRARTHKCTHTHTHTPLLPSTLQQTPTHARTHTCTHTHTYSKPPPKPLAIHPHSIHTHTHTNTKSLCPHFLGKIYILKEQRLGVRPKQWQKQHKKMGLSAFPPPLCV